MSYTSQDTFNGTIFSRLPTRDRKMAWSRYRDDTSFTSEATFPSTGLIDAFTRVDGALTPPWYTGYYGGSSPKLKVTSNALQSAGGMYADAYYGVTYPANQEAYLTVAAVLASDQVEITARLRNEGTSQFEGYAFSFYYGSVCHIYKYVKGVQTALWTGTQALSAGDSIGIRCVGNVIQAWYKASSGSWTKVAQVIDSDVPGPGKFAIYVESASARVDDFGGGEFYDHRRIEGVSFNTPALIEPGSEWAHPYFDKVRSYNPCFFVTWREAITGAVFTPIDYRSSSPNTFGAMNSPYSYASVIDGPIAGYKGVYHPADDNWNKYSISALSPYPTTQITVAAWVKQWYGYNWPNYVNKNWPNAGSWLLYSSTTAAIFGVCDATPSQKNAIFPVTDFNMFDGNWHFLVGTYDGSAVKCYIDGMLGSGWWSPGAITLASGNVDLHGGGGYLDRAMGPIFVLPTALSQAQIQELYNIALSYPVTADPLDSYKITSVSGWDRPDVRDARTERAGDHGEVPLPALTGGRNIVIGGQIRASNLARLRYMVRRLREECAAEMRAEASMDSGFWRQSPGTLTVFDPLEIEPVSVSGRVIDLKIEEQQKSMNPYRDFQMTIRTERQETGVFGAYQIGTTVNLIAGASVFAGSPGAPSSPYFVDSIIRIGNYPSGAATAAINGSLVISSTGGPNGSSEALAFTSPVWAPNEWWEINSRECSVKAYGLSASAYNKMSYVAMASTSPQFVRALSATTFLQRAGTVSAGTPKLALFTSDGVYL